MMSNRSIKVSNREESRALVIEALDNAEGAARDIVALNAGLAIYAGNKAGSIPEALALAFEMIATGAARAKLEEFCAYPEIPKMTQAHPEALRASPQGHACGPAKPAPRAWGPPRRAHALSPQGARLRTGKAGSAASLLHGLGFSYCRYCTCIMDQ